MRVALAVALALVLAGAGCFGPGPAPLKIVPYLPLNDAQPGRATEFAFYLQSLSPFRQDLVVRVADLPEGWRFEPEASTLALPGEKAASLVVRVTPDANATYGPRRIGIEVGGARADVIVNVRDLGREPLRAGIGAQVHYVLWLANGTLRATNHPAARDQPGIPAFPTNATDDAAMRPLKVYVGGQRGQPPPEPYNSTGCEGDEQPPCYHPVIPGFDARLRDAGDGRGMVAGETLAVRVPKQLAYTVPGNEQHPLYGEDLAFLVFVASVDELPVRPCELPVCPPTSMTSA